MGVAQGGQIQACRDPDGRGDTTPDRLQFSNIPKESTLKKAIQSLYLVAALAMASTAAVANDASFTGSFTGDNDVQLFHFSLSAPGFVTVRTLSFSGGVNASGETIASGGFDPILSLFDGAGNFISYSDDSFFTLDSYLENFLDAGSYTAALTQFANFPAGANLSDGFSGTGHIDFAGQSAHWAVDFYNVDSAAAVPEPGTYALMAGGLAAVALLRRRKTAR